jgi:hypothetical protein
MMRCAAIVGLMLADLVLAVPAGAQSGGTAVSQPAAQVHRPPRRHARPRIEVHPRYHYRRYNTIYPPPYDYEYPGPNGRRVCVDGYAVERRPSGSVVTPWMRCQWVSH